MLPSEIVRSWKDEEYRFSLTGAEQSMLPGDPAGLVALGDDELSEAGGGADPLVSIMILPPLIFPLITSPIICLFPREDPAPR